MKKSLLSLFELLSFGHFVIFDQEDVKLCQSLRPSRMPIIKGQAEVYACAVSRTNICTRMKQAFCLGFLGGVTGPVGITEPFN